jgi:pimeloyl-ACP methyl ester carboxylesterase
VSQRSFIRSHQPVGHLSTHRSKPLQTASSITLTRMTLPKLPAASSGIGWGAGAYDAMDDRTREAITAGMAKLRVEWPDAFQPHGATVEALSALRMPIQLIAGSRTTPAAKAVVDVLRSLWPGTSYAEIEGAGHMAPVTHPERVNEVIDTFVSSL